MRRNRWLSVGASFQSSHYIIVIVKLQKLSGFVDRMPILGYNQSWGKRSSLKVIKYYSYLETVSPGLLSAGVQI